jgi:hypothetical protein
VDILQLGADGVSICTFVPVKQVLLYLGKDLKKRMSERTLNGSYWIFAARDLSDGLPRL